MKNIRVEIFVNGDADGIDINLTDEEADKLLALQQKAFDTILKGVEEEDYWEQFDSWLNEKTPDLYKKIMKAFYEDLLCVVIKVLTNVKCHFRNILGRFCL